MRKILLTGAAGFVGRRFAKRLLDQGDEVYAVDSLAEHTGAMDPSRGWPLFDPRSYSNFHFFHADCREWFNRRHDDDFDYAFHLAAMVGGRQMIESNPLAVADDLSIDAAYWRWAWIARPKKTITFSSSAAYPIKLQRRDHYALLSEEMISFDDDIGMPDMTYGWAKLTCEYLGRVAHERHGLKSVCYRPFSGYGEDQDDAYPFPSICARAIDCRGGEVLRVWGSGGQMRDFIHIDDCVDAVFRTMDKIDDATAVNLCTGIFTSMAELARLAAEALGWNPQILGTTDTPEGVFARAGDPGKLLRLGFSPTIDLRSGIERSLRFHSEAHPTRALERPITDR
jgi:GDP-L-fucose synthase